MAYASERMLVHRDLHGLNVIVQENKITIIDFQIAVRAHPYWELAGSAVQEWHDPKFQTVFSALPIMQAIVRDRGEQSVYRALALHRIIADFAFEYPDREPAGGAYLKDILEMKTHTYDGTP
jgi:thiamine kinase-like enzyme